VPDAVSHVFAGKLQAKWIVESTGTRTMIERSMRIYHRIISVGV